MWENIKRFFLNSIIYLIFITVVCLFFHLKLELELLEAQQSEKWQQCKTFHIEKFKSLLGWKFEDYGTVFDFHRSNTWFDEYLVHNGLIEKRLIGNRSQLGKVFGQVLNKFQTHQGDYG